MPLQPNSTFVKVTRCNGEPSNDGTERFTKFRRQLETTPFTSGMFPVIPSTSYPPPIGRLDLFFFFQPSHFGRSFFSFFLYFRLNKQKRNQPGEPSRTNGGFSMRQFFSRKSLAWDGPVADLRSFFLLPFRIPCAGITHSWSFNLKKQKKKQESFLPWIAHIIRAKRTFAFRNLSSHLLTALAFSIELSISREFAIFLFPLKIWLIRKSIQCSCLVVDSTRLTLLIKKNELFSVSSTEKT